MKNLRRAPAASVRRVGALHKIGWFLPRRRGILAIWPQEGEIGSTVLLWYTQAASPISSSRDEFTGKTDGTAAVTMPRDIQPLRPDDLPELSRFLVTGFQARPDADFADPAVLRWKYLDPKGLGSAAARSASDRPLSPTADVTAADSGVYCDPPLSYVAQ